MKPSIIKDKTSNHIEILNNTIENINRLNVNFNEFDIKNFLFSTRFLFQNLDRVQIFDNEFKLIDISCCFLVFVDVILRM